MTLSDLLPVRRALLSVSDKTGLSEFARILARHGVEILSTGGTARALQEAGVKVRDVTDLTGFPEILDGRVKTLHPAVHAGLLARRDLPEHLRVLEERGLPTIDLVCVNLYPFEAVTARPGVPLDEAVENIDIGGPSMIRSAAKNHDAVAVVVSPARYAEVAAALDENQGRLPRELRRRLAVEAFAHTARYDAAIHDFLHARYAPGKWPDVLLASGILVQAMRYGENPHQRGAFYRDATPGEGSLALAERLQGKELSYNNVMDADACAGLLSEFRGHACVIVKHANPCGVAEGEKPADAFTRALDCDPLSAFGGVVGFNRPVDAEAARAVLEGLSFFEILLVPDLDGGARKAFAARKNLRVLRLPGLGKGRGRGGMDLRRVAGGYLVQEEDATLDDAASFRTVTKREPTEREWRDLDFAWRVVRHSKSNAMVAAKDGATVGIGCGQTSRVGALETALRTAGAKAQGAVVASEALLPFRDSVDLCAKAGVSAIVQTGGSVRDAEVLQAAEEHGIAMVFTGVRHFKH